MQIGKEGYTMDLKGTQTLKNLEYAFAGESKARNKYTYYACLLYTSRRVLQKYSGNGDSLLLPSVEAYTFFTHPGVVSIRQ